MRKRSVLTAAILVTVGATRASFGLPSSLNINFANQPTSADVPDTGFNSAYNPLPDPNPGNSNALTATGFYVGADPYGYSPSNALNIWTDGNDIFGDYERDPDTAHNVFYSNFATGSQTTVTTHVFLQNLDNDYHGGGIWLGTDEDHYIRLGVIYNNNQGINTVTGQPNPPKANVEMLRENEDLWPPQPGGDGHSGDGNDIADQQEVLASSALTPGQGYLNTVDITLQLILTGSTARAQYSLDGGTTWLPVNAAVPYFAGVATSTTDGATVEGGFKVGVFGFGGNSGTNGAAVVSFENFSASTVTLANVKWTGAAGNNNASSSTNFANLTTTANLGNEGRIYEFPNVSSSRTTVNLDAGLAGTLDVGGLVFSSPNGYTINGPQALVVNGGLIDSQQGVNIINAPLVISGNARIDSQIHVANGSTLQLVGATVPRLNSLVVDSGGKLDLTTNSAMIDYETSATDPFTSIQAMVKSGYANGSWTGSGIISSAAALHNAGTGLAVIDTGVTPWPRLQMFGPHNVGSGDPASSAPGSTSRDVLIMYTWLGDINLDGKVTSTDLSAMGTGTAGSQTWANGDFNYDGTVNADDYSLFQLGNAVQTGTLVPAPEPAGAMMLLSAIPYLMRRRK